MNRTTWIVQDQLHRTAGSNTLDVTENGLKVIELNCFNGSNFYLMDVSRIVRNVSRYLEAITPIS